MNKYEEAGMTYLIPGMLHMLDLMQAEIMRMIDALQNNQTITGASPMAQAVRTYWAKMTPKQRQAEMERRGLIRQKKASPAKKVYSRKYWQAMTAEERSAEMRRRFKLAKGSRKPNGRAEART